MRTPVIATRIDLGRLSLFAVGLRSVPTTSPSPRAVELTYRLRELIHGVSRASPAAPRRGPDVTCGQRLLPNKARPERALRAVTQLWRNRGTSTADKGDPPRHSRLGAHPLCPFSVVTSAAHRHHASKISSSLSSSGSSSVAFRGAGATGFRTLAPAAQFGHPSRRWRDVCSPPAGPVEGDLLAFTTLARSLLDRLCAPAGALRVLMGLLLPRRIPCLYRTTAWPTAAAGR
jgi:hypothetical protein